MELQTDEEKIQAAAAIVVEQVNITNDLGVHKPGAKPEDQQVKAAVVNVATAVNLIPVDLLESCQKTQLGEHENTSDSPITIESQCDPDLVCQPVVEACPATVSDSSRTMNEVPGQPLSEETLQKSGVQVTEEDFPMIDDDVDEDVTGNEERQVVSLQEGVAEVCCPENCSDDTARVDVQATVEPAHPDEPLLESSSAAIRIATPLKSALKKGNGSSNRSKRGQRVTFQDSRVFYIDTEAEASAAPQLLTVCSLDLPLSANDFRVLKPSYEMISSTGSGTDRLLSYQDAVVTLQNGDESVEEEEVEQLEQADVGGNEALGAAPETQIQKRTTITTDLDAVVMSSAEVTLPEVANSASAEAQQEVQSLTEANLRQHEILMEQDATVEVPEPDVNDGSVSSQQPIPLVSSNGGKTLSPPLKELTVDVGALNSVPVQENWQVELSPLNSIPESETDSSTSSQDTIIMMTSEENRRNQEHIRHSTLTFQQQVKKQDDSSRADVASTGSSQDSDETLKCCDDTQDTGPVRIKVTDLENNENQIVLSQRSSSEIRQLMERNAIRRNLLRYGNTRKKIPTEGPSTVSITTNRPHQRQWRSQESLVDTIKKLTIEDNNNSSYDNISRFRGDEDDDNSLFSRSFSRLTNGNIKEEDEDEFDEVGGRNDNYAADHLVRFRHHNSLTRGGAADMFAQDRPSSALSLQDIRSLIASPHNIEGVMRKQRATSSTIDVPGDVRQWKIQSSKWNSVQGRNALNRMNPVIPHGFRDAAEQGDELAQFVQQDSDRIERIKKRYSYSDGDDYEMIGAFARRSSVRGIKPKFGSTSEILKQMQSQLQPPLLANPPNNNNHMTWPYPAMQSSNASYHQTPRSTGVLPVLQEEPPFQRLQQHSSPEVKPVLRTRRGRDGTYIQVLGVQGGGGAPPPPPYQPPPAPVSRVSQHQYSIQQAQCHPVHLYQTLRNHSKDERGVPEGASSSPKVTFDSSYHSPPTQNQHLHSPAVIGSKDRELYPDVYYVMQV